MYSILIVDDEKSEREGLKKLLKRYHFDFNVYLASGGEEALAILQKHEINVLLTDIKMPKMDGITLIKEVRKRNYNPICIIYSAYGEFEYAQNAISLGVMEYLLKPVRLEAFEALFQKVMKLCETRYNVEKEQEKNKRIQEEAASYKMSWKILGFLEQNDGERKESTELTTTLFQSETVCVPVLISCYMNLFSMEWDTYKVEISRIFDEKMWIINKADNEIILLLQYEKKNFKLSLLKKQCEKLLEESKNKYQTEILVVIGKNAENLPALKCAYDSAREWLDYQFFASHSLLIVDDEAFLSRKDENMLSMYFERIFNCAEMEDYIGVKKGFVKVFSYVEQQSGFSSIYVKYIFTDAIKKIREYANADVDLIEYVQQIYETKSFEELRNVINEFMDHLEMSKSKETQENRLVKMAKTEICEKYGDSNLSVSLIADLLHVTPAYLSSLFKINTGQNLIKYITDFRIKKAKELLEQSNMRISDVATEVGYVNASYFTSIFRTREGISPVHYREKAHENQ